jgi:hypothetical protein
MKTRAAVAFEAKRPLEIVELGFGRSKGRRSFGRDHGNGDLPYRCIYAGWF